MTSSRSNRAKLCICADDFGQHKGVNDAVLRLAGMGRLHAVGALVGAPAWKSGTGTLRRLDAEGIDVGLHLDLTEFPQLPGVRRPLGRLIAHAVLHRLDRIRVRAEIRAQLDVFESALGHGPSFIDGHQHVHQLRGVRDELLAELDDRYGGYLPWIRCTRAVSMSGLASRADARSRLKGLIIEWVGAHGLRTAARRHGFGQNGRLLGVYDFQGGASRYQCLLHRWLDVARDGDLLMCHPGLPNAAADPLGAARVAEFQVLGSTAFGELLRDTGVSLWPMSQILANRA